MLHVTCYMRFDIGIRRTGDAAVQFARFCSIFRFINKPTPKRFCLLFDRLVPIRQLLIRHYAKMERENPDLAECFNFYLAEDGFDKAVGLSDDRYRKLFKKQLTYLRQPCVMDFSKGTNYHYPLHPFPGAFFIC